MNTRILTIAAAAVIALSAAGFNATASAAPLGMASQSIAQSADSPIIQVGGGHNGGKGHGKHGNWHGKHGNWHGHKKFYPKSFHYGLYPAPYYYGGCLQQIKTWDGYVLINVCH